MNGPYASASPLAPADFLARSAVVHGKTMAVQGQGIQLTYEELAARAERAAGMFGELGLPQGGTVSVLAPNSLAMLESHFAVPWAGGVLNALNTRLSATEIRYILDHAESRIVVVDESLVDLAEESVQGLARRPTLVIAGGPASDYEQRIDRASPVRRQISDETEMIALNYTSGTTGQPKGVMYSHRGAYLQALAMVVHIGLSSGAKYLWTLPMFHCNGWTFPWSVTAAGGTHVLLDRPDPGLIWDALEAGATHLCAAPTVLSRLAAMAPATTLEQQVTIATGGAPPSPTLLGTLADLGIEVVHVYGLTETYGPAAICDWRPEWNDLPAADRARLKARQGVPNVISQPLRVRGVNGDVPADGATVGEIQFRGNNVMLGYHRDAEATAGAFEDGWFRTGDLGVLHPDGYVELRDRLKDIIISGGENIASVEVEHALDSHPEVLESAVVGVPDSDWGEAVTAFVTLIPGASLTELELIDHVKGRIARYKAPRRIVFGDLPKTASGKIQKFKLRIYDLSRQSP